MFEMIPLTETRKNENYTSISRPSSNASDREDTSHTQEPLRRSIWLDSWLFEWITLAFGIACFTAIIIVLYIFDGKEQPKMSHDLSLNTIISVLATACKSALVLVLGEAISQLKWLWFQDPRQSQNQLVGIQRFDAASRGPLGSLMIVFYHRARSLASLGAIVIVFLLAFDPFMQQIISYPIRTIPDTNITAHAAAPQSYGFYPTENEDDLNDAFIQGFFSSKSFDIPPQCSASNCTWDKFPSIGICSSCTNMTNAVQLDCELPSMEKSFNKTCKISLPDTTGYTFNVKLVISPHWAPAMTLPRRIIWQPMNLLNRMANMAGGDIKGNLELPNVTFSGVMNPLTTVAYVELGLDSAQISANPNASLSHSIYLKNATGCALSTCRRMYDISVTNAIPSIRTEDADFGTIYMKNLSKTAVSSENHNIPTLSICWMPGPFDPSGYQESRNFSFCDDAMYSLQGVRGWLPNTINDEDIDPERPDESASPDSDWTRMEIFKRIGFEKIMENIAASLTRYSLEYSNDTILGRTTVTQVFVSVRWPWIIYPAILVVVGTIFFVATIVVSKKSNLPLWKSSGLASYYHGLERVNNIEDDSEYLTTSAMEKRAEKEDVRLEPSEKNGRLVMRQKL